MRDITFAILVGLTVLALALCMAYAVIDTNEQDGQLKNQYCPFSVETVVHDKQ